MGHNYDDFESNVEIERQIDEQTKLEQAKIQEYMNTLRDQMFKIDVEVLEGGKLPAKAHRTDAGFDVYATEDLYIVPGEIVKHPLNIRMKLPTGTWARIETKSGLGSKGHFVYAGVIDEGYRGIPHAIMTNLNHAHKSGIHIKKGEKLAQITMNPHSNEYFIRQVETVSTETDRGEGGFGSSGQ
jgi:dUTP pyrophosphatase